MIAYTETITLFTWIGWGLLGTMLLPVVLFAVARVLIPADDWADPNEPPKEVL